MSFSLDQVRSQIPQLSVKVRGRDLVYLDNAATTLKPEVVIERVSHYYRTENANVHRGAHALAEVGTELYERARKTVADFIGASNSSEIVFTRGTTESINLISQSLALLGSSLDSKKMRGLAPGDEVLVSELEHHSNIVPWQLACARAGATLRSIPITESGEIDVAALEKLINEKTKVVAFSCCSNVLGTITDVKSIVKTAKKSGAIVAVDAAQMVTAEAIDVIQWGADFVSFSGHKLFAPFGIGVLWAANDWLDVLPPYQGGGSMIDTVTFAKTTWADAPHKFEAGTPNVSGAVGLASAINWFASIGSLQAISHAKALAENARTQLAAIDGIQIYGTSKSRTSIVSFNLLGVHSSDIATLLDQQGIAIRSGHHCCQPLMQKLNCTSAARASFSIYNTKAEVDEFIMAIRKAKDLLT